jgi:D-alanyl-D-alanine carboxypeptidase/D-alanyl-D-alanine-endopeptidase (penicillin-binding protein 4)
MMKKVFLFFTLFAVHHLLTAQTVNERVRKSFDRFMADSQLKHAAVSLYVIDAKTGQPVFDANSQMGLAPASTQKIITSVTAFELLGKDYRYKTVFTGDKNVVYVSGFGDPTFGSWRYQQTKPSVLFPALIKGLNSAGIKTAGEIIVYANETEGIVPAGWINEDAGNYYGAGAQLFNFNENQYELTLIPGNKVGAYTKLDTSLTKDWQLFFNQCMTGAPGSGDNAYIYFVPGSPLRTIKGTIPAGVKNFTISGSDPNPYTSFLKRFLPAAAKAGFYTGKAESYKYAPWYRNDTLIVKEAKYTYYSPSLDSIIYWFNKKSINLYGEALIKTFALEKQGYASTDSGVAILRRFWKDKGLDPEELNMYDGSGLSPLNRVTTHAQVEVLKYAKSRNWFPAFYDALPEYNGMKMKSGTISDVKGYCGYHKAKDGREYIFSFLINNYSGKTAPVVSKMFKVLDELK